MPAIARKDDLMRLYGIQGRSPRDFITNPVELLFFIRGTDNGPALFCGFITQECPSKGQLEPSRRCFNTLWLGGWCRFGPDRLFSK